MYLGALEYYDSVVPGGMAAVLASIKDGDLVEFLSQRFLAASWYDVMPMAPLASAAARVRGVSVGQVLEERGRWQVQRDLLGVHRALLTNSTPEEVVKRMPRAGAQYFDFGEIRVEVVRPGVGEGVRTDLPAVLRAWYAHGTAAYVKAALEAAGAKEPEVRFRAGEVIGAREGFTMLNVPFDITWK
jgi:hypothetical protein